MEVERTIRNHAFGSAGVGLIPLPVVDLVAITGVQLNMLRVMAATYGVPFSRDTAKHLIAALVGSAVPVSLGTSIGSMIKAVPVVGNIAGMLAMPAIAAATTYAIGKVFEMHFESGGTFLDFDPDKVRDYYEEMFKEGKKLSQK